MTTATTSISARTPVEAKLAHASPRDFSQWLVLAGAAVISVGALALAYRSGAILRNPDALVHLQVARRVVAGQAPGLAQLDGETLPLNRLLMTPLVVFDELYTTGLAGGIVSAISYLICCGFLYQIIRRIVQARESEASTRIAAIIGTMVFALNPHVLELQSMPLPHLPLYATVLGAVYYLGMWLEEPERYASLPRAAVYVLMATLISYDAWFVAVALTVLVMWRSWKFSIGKPGITRWRRLQDTTIVFCCVGFAGIVGWLVWRALLFGQPPGLPFAAAEVDIAPGELGSGLFSFTKDSLRYIPFGLVPLVLAALVRSWLVRRRGGQQGGLAGTGAALCAALVGFLLHAAARPWLVAEPSTAGAEDHPALVLVLLVAMLVGYLIGQLSGWLGRLSSRAPVILGLVAALVLLGEPAVNRDRLEESPSVMLAATSASAQKETVEAFAAIYDGGDVLMDTTGNEMLAFPPWLSDALIHQGVNQAGRWQRSLGDPAGMRIRWIVMRCAPGWTDVVCQTLSRDPERLAAYELRYAHPDESAYQIYRLRETR